MSLWHLPALGLASPSDPDRPVGPVVGPALVAYFCPAMHKRPEGFAPPPEGWDGEQLDLLDLPAEPAWACPPSQFVQSSELPRRNGFRGLTSKGKRAVKDSCAILEAQRDCMSFWTVSLPDDALASIAAGDLWPRFVAELRRLLVRRMASAGLPPHVIGVAELHPDRSQREQCPLPHLHIVYRSKRTSRRPWLMGKEAHTGLIAQALGVLGIYPASLAAASRVEKIRKSVGRYISKYISKAKSLEFCVSNEIQDLFNSVPQTFIHLVCLAAPFGGFTCQPLAQLQAHLARLVALVPRQWWFRSDELGRLVASLSQVLPFQFCRWLVAHAPQAPWGHEVHLLYLAPCETGAPPIWRLAWDSCDSLAHLLAIWQQDCEDAEAITHESIRHGCLGSCLDSLQYQLV
jgi:hypothetical protein